MFMGSKSTTTKEGATVFEVSSGDDYILSGCTFSFSSSTILKSRMMAG